MTCDVCPLFIQGKWNSAVELHYDIPMDGIEMEKFSKNVRSSRLVGRSVVEVKSFECSLIRLNDLILYYYYIIICYW